jgi:putative molybdenum carrier protein
MQEYRIQKSEFRSPELRTEMLRKIISGGQTGADRAGLDFAIEVGLGHGGSVPRGRLAEDGPISQKYRLTELSSDSYEVRTRQNVQESDGTAIFTLAPAISGGSKLTLDYASEIGKPFLHIYHGRARNDLPALMKAAEQLRNFIQSKNIEILNVAGSRESVEPGIYTLTLDVLRAFWKTRGAGSFTRYQ